MKELAEAERRYEVDSEFRSLVDAITQHAMREAYSAHEVMLAALAAVRMVDRQRNGAE